MAQDQPIYVPLDTRGVLSVEGADATAFLQDLITNNLEKVDAGTPVYAALLTPQGKFLHDFFVLRRGAAYLFDCEGPRLIDLAKRLAAYRLRATVSFADATEDYRVVALFGEGAADAIALGPDGRMAEWLGGLVFPDPRADGLGLRALLPPDAVPAGLEEHGFAAGEAADYERLRLSLGVPDGSRDMAVEKATLMESNFDALHGVDFDKGCYVGQELTARMKYRGLVRKRLMRVAVDGAAPPPGTPITAAGRDIGELRTAFDGQGIALLRLDRAADAADAGTPMTAGDATVTPAEDLPADAREAGG